MYYSQSVKYVKHYLMVNFRTRYNAILKQKIRQPSIQFMAGSLGMETKVPLEQYVCLVCNTELIENEFHGSK